jgi:hypothetical protein
MDFTEANTLLQAHIRLLDPIVQALFETGPARFAHDAALRILLTCHEPDAASFGPDAADDLLNGMYRASQVLIAAAEGALNGTLMDRLLDPIPRNMRPPRRRLDPADLPFLPGTVSFEHGGRRLIGLAYRPVIDPAHPPMPAELDAELQRRGFSSPTAEELFAMLSAVKYRTPGTYASALAVPFTAPDADPAFQGTGYPHVRTKGTTLQPGIQQMLSLGYLAGVIDFETVEAARKKKMRSASEAAEHTTAPEPETPKQIPKPVPA